MTAVRRRRELVHDLLHRDDHPPGRKRHLLLHAGDAPQHHVAPGVRLLGVEHRDVGADGGRGREPLAGEGAFDEPDERVVRRQVGAGVAPDHAEGEPARARDIGVGEVGMAALLDLHGPGPAVLHRIAEAVQRAHPRIAAPGEDQAPDAAHADELVVDEVRRHAHRGEVAEARADHRVARGMGDQVGEPLHGDGVAVFDERGHRLGERDDLGHAPGVR